MKPLLSFLFSIFLFFGLHAQQPDIPINPNFTWNGESSLGVNPENPNNLIATWMKLTTLTQVTIAVSRSMDGGVTWSEPYYMPHFDANFTSADPTLVFSNNGSAYFAYIDYNKGTMAAGGVYVCNSPDQGATWSTPVKTIDFNAAPDWPVDRPWLVVDNSGGSYNGWLYLVTKGANAAPFPHHLYLMVSSDDGATWSIPKRIDQQVPIGPQSNAMGVPAVSSDGKLSVAYLSYDPVSSPWIRNIITTSVNGGTTFTYNVIDILPVASIIPPTDTLFQYSYCLSANPTQASNLVFLYTDRRNGDLDILACNSFDGGLTWGTVMRINDDPISNGVAQDMCWGGFSGGGKFAALWRDRREGGTAQDAPYKIYGTWSSDGGTTFQANFPLSSDPGALAIPIDGNDFLGATLSDSLIFGTWADKRGFSNQIFYNWHAFSSPSSMEEYTQPFPHKFLPEWIQMECVNLSGDIKSKFTRLSIFDLAGKMLLQSYDPEEVCFRGMVNGCYIAILHTSEGNAYQKIFLVR